MNAFVLTTRAEQDLNEIWLYIADDNEEAAHRVLIRIEDVLRKLARSPALGHYREELVDRRYRLYLVGSYLIVYRWSTTPLQIIRVLHAARDVQALLQRETDQA